MRKLSLFLLSAVLLFSLVGCSSLSQFDGSRTGNDSRLIMEYKTLNKTDSQEFVLTEGDVLTFNIVSEAGTVDLRVQMDGETAVYQGNDVPTSSFEVVIPVMGTYKCSVTGKQAQGSISVKKRKSSCIVHINEGTGSSLVHTTKKRLMRAIFSYLPYNTLTNLSLIYVAYA